VQPACPAPHTTFPDTSTPCAFPAHAAQELKIILVSEREALAEPHGQCVKSVAREQQQRSPPRLGERDAPHDAITSLSKERHALHPWLTHTSGRECWRESSWGIPRHGARWLTPAPCLHSARAVSTPDAAHQRLTLAGTTVSERLEPGRPGACARQPRWGFGRRPIHALRAQALSTTFSDVFVAQLFGDVVNTPREGTVSAT
jgi:hypothetical protein